MSVKMTYALITYFICTNIAIAQPWYGAYEKQPVDDYVNSIAKYAHFVACVRATHAQSHSLTEAQQKCTRST